MKSLLQILNEVSKDCGCEDFRHATENARKHLIEYIIEEAGRHFLKQSKI